MAVALKQSSHSSDVYNLQDFMDIALSAQSMLTVLEDDDEVYEGTTAASITPEMLVPSRSSKLERKGIDFLDQNGTYSPHLRSHQCKKTRDDFCSETKQRKSAYCTSMKYDRYQYPDTMNLSRPQTSKNSKCEEDIILTVSCLVPYNRVIDAKEMRSSKVMKPETKFLVRGNSNLQDLRNHMFCVCDNVVPLENGKELLKPDMSKSVGQLFPSSFFFINNVFYVDMSHRNSIDISAPIREFLKRKHIDIELKVEEMSSVNILDLSLRLGHPYVLQHSGTCEHLVMFHDLRLIHPADHQESFVYPMIVYEKCFERRCEVCHKSHSSFVVEKSEILPELYTFFCDNCFAEFNFSNGMKLSEFTAWQYQEPQQLRFTSMLSQTTERLEKLEE